MTLVSIYSVILVVAAPFYSRSVLPSYIGNCGTCKSIIFIKWILETTRRPRPPVKEKYDLLESPTPLVSINISRLGRLTVSF